MNPKIWAGLAVVVAGGALAFNAFGNLGENLVYYWSPTELHQAGAKAQGATIRLGGLVKPGTVQNDGGVLTFQVVDNSDTVHVRTTEIPPAMFREGIGVVVEGTVDEAGQFNSKRLMVKHDNEYRAPTAGETPDKSAMFGTLAEGSTPPENAQ